MPGQATRGARWAFLLAASAAISACASAEIAYDLRPVQARPAPVHALRVAVLPFEDARAAEDAKDEADAFVFQGREYVHSDLGELAQPPGFVFAELLARHLAAARVFEQVILVRRAEDAPEADLVLSADIRRARGYVEAQAGKSDPSSAKEARRVIAELFVGDVSLRENRQDGRMVFRSDVGWSILRDVDASASPSPWSVLGEALFVANDQLVHLLEDAYLDGRYVVRDRVSLPLASDRRSDRTGSSSAAIDLGALTERPPAGWAFERPPAGAPEGWTGPGQGCLRARFSAHQTQRFHRVLGPYRPVVDLWICDPEQSLRLSSRFELPAVYLGRDPSGRHVFVRQLGESNWPRAEAELGALMQLEPPSSRYVFEIGPSARPPPEPKPALQGRPRRKPLGSATSSAKQPAVDVD